jgi:hypothetical protein
MSVEYGPSLMSVSTENIGIVYKFQYKESLYSEITAVIPTKAGHSGGTFHRGSILERTMWDLYVCKWKEASFNLCSGDLAILQEPEISSKHKGCLALLRQS